MQKPARPHRPADGAGDGAHGAQPDLQPGARFLLLPRGWPGPPSSARRRDPILPAAAVFEPGAAIVARFGGAIAPGDVFSAERSPTRSGGNHLPRLGDLRVRSSSAMTSRLLPAPAPINPISAAARRGPIIRRHRVFHEESAPAPVMKLVEADVACREDLWGTPQAQLPHARSPRRRPARNARLHPHRGRGRVPPPPPPPLRLWRKNSDRSGARLFRRYFSTMRNVARFRAVIRVCRTALSRGEDRT